MPRESASIGLPRAKTILFVHALPSVAFRPFNPSPVISYSLPLSLQSCSIFLPHCFFYFPFSPFLFLCPFCLFSFLSTAYFSLHPHSIFLFFPTFSFSPFRFLYVPFPTSVVHLILYLFFLFSFPGRGGGKYGMLPVLQQ